MIRQPTLAALLLAAALVSASMAGCGAPSLTFVSGGSDLEIRSQTHPGRTLTGDFDRALYRLDSDTSVTIVLLSGAEEALEQAAVVRMFWRPQAGATPISSSATNASVQYVVFAPGGAGGDVGVYSGAGFLHPNSDLGQGTLRAGLWEATLRLADRSGGFADLLGKATLRGDVTARRDDAGVHDLLRQLDRQVSERLGYPRLVLAEPLD